MPIRIEATRNRAHRGRLLRPLLVAVLVAACACAGSSAAWAQQAPGQAAQNEFVPVKDLGRQEQLPAAPLLVAAYIVVWLALFVYVWSIWRRLGKVDRELSELKARLADRPEPDKRR